MILKTRQDYLDALDKLKDMIERGIITPREPLIGRIKIDSNMWKNSITKSTRKEFV